MPTRFENTGEGLYTFADVFYVQCPVCGGCATVREIEPERAHNPVVHPQECIRNPRVWNHAARLLCPQCAHTKDLKTNGVWRGVPNETRDRWFDLPLWFQTPCCGKTLWAYNRPHLAYLKRYVEADLRDECSYPNSGLARYLPQWMKAAKNRDEVLRGLHKLMQIG